MADEPPTEPLDGGGATARERRAERVKAQGRKDAPKKAAKMAAIVVGIAVVLAGGVWAISKIHIEGPPGHEHSVFRMWADGKEVNFNYPQFDLQYTKFLDAHLHLSAQSSETTSSQYVVHAEGTRRVALGTFFDTLGVTTGSNDVKLNAHVSPPMHPDATEFHNNATYSWQLWIDHCSDGPDNFVKEGKLFGYKPQHHDRMLITFAPSASTAASLQPEWSGIPSEQDLQRDLKDTCGKGAPTKAMG